MIDVIRTYENIASKLNIIKEARLGDISKSRLMYQA